MTKEERLELVKHLTKTRPGENKPFEAPKFYYQYYKNTTVEEKVIKTSAGDTSIWLIDKIGRQKNNAVFINIHGGGFVAPHMERDIAFCRRIAAELGILVVDISYRTVEESGFPVACHECYDCVKWVVKHKDDLSIDTSRIIVGGHSAGANLTVGIALQAKQKKEFDLALLVLDYPPLDLFTDPADKPESDKTMISPQRARDFNLLYVGNETNAKNILASPVLATREELMSLPETLIYTAGHDNLRFEAERFANQLVEAGVQVTVRRFLNSGHGFVIGCAGEYNEAIYGMEEAMLKVVHRIENVSVKYDTADGDPTFTGEE